MKIHAGLVLLVLAAGFSGCDKTVTGPTPRLGGAPPTSGNSNPPFHVVSDTVPASNGSVPGVYQFDVTVPRSGDATVALSWPNADVSLQLYFTDAACPNTTSLLTGACTTLGESRGNPPVLATSPVMSGDTITVWVLNPDPVSQTVTVGIEIK